MNPFSFSGPISRGAYAGWGCALMAVKYNLDRLVAWLAFGLPWDPTSYLRFDTPIRRLDQSDRLQFYTAMLLLALPFIWVGVSLTVRRLRAVGASGLWVCLFFVPILNLLLFLSMCFVPDQDEPEPGPLGAEPATPANSWLPEKPVAIAATAALLSTGGGIALTVLAANFLENYGWGLFVGVPFVSGLTASLILNWRARTSLGRSLGVGMLSVSLIGAGLLVLAVEGVICLLMAAPIGLPLGALGGALGYAVSNERPDAGRPAASLVLWLALPLLMGAEAQAPDPAPALPCVTSVVIDAPPEVVWPLVVAFPDLPPPKRPLLRTGVAYPVRARIEGQGVGATRYCEFSTGPFVEPIEVWDPPRRLAFSVSSQPVPMDEWSPYAAIHPPHLDGTLTSERGQFLLERLPGGKTRLVGTTWYSLEMWPASYWRGWSDQLIHAIHSEVLEHIKREAEKG
ncbi:MAG: DUF805 domain-containing protein [Vulcanimicrobiota bacterium]